jgi:hypothetical protein
LRRNLSKLSSNLSRLTHSVANEHIGFAVVEQPEMLDSGVAGKQFPVKGRVLLLGTLELLGEESQGLPVLLAR